jgi:hypothetical protein
MKSQGHDKSRHSAPAQLSSRLGYCSKRWLLPLFRLPLLLSTSFSSPTCLAGRLSRSPCVVISSPSVLFAILSESDVLLEAQLGAQLLTLLDLCRYHLQGVQLASVVPHHLHRLRGPLQTPSFSNEANGAKKAKRKSLAGPFYPRAYEVSIASASALPERDRFSNKRLSIPVFPHPCSSFPIAPLLLLRGRRGSRPVVSCACFFPGQESDGCQRDCRVA